MEICWYRPSDDSDRSNNAKTWFGGAPQPCGPAAGDDRSCCAPGHRCLSDGLCHAGTNNQTGFYVAACSDPTFSSSRCRTLCHDTDNPDIAYVGGGRWQCCGAPAGSEAQVGAGCANPSSNQSFSAPSPAALLAAASDISSAGLPVAASAAASLRASANNFRATAGVARPDVTLGGGFLSPNAAATSVAASTPSGSQSSQTQAAQSSGLSTGAAIGIGVGVGIAAILIATVALALLFWRHRRRRKIHVAEMDAKPGVAAATELSPDPLMAELCPKPQLYEATGDGSRHETQGSALHEAPPGRPQSRYELGSG